MAELETASTAVHMQQRLCLGLKGGGRKVKRVPADEPTTTPSTMDRGAAVSEATQVAPRRTETKDVATQFMSSQDSVWRSGSAAECGDFDVEEGSQPRRRCARTTRRRVADGLRSVSEPSQRDVLLGIAATTPCPRGRIQKRSSTAHTR